jgi:uncharacterized protein DUF3592
MSACQAPILGAMGTVEPAVAWILAHRDALRRYAWIPQLMVSLFLLVMAYVMGADHLRLIRDGVRAPGRVVGSERRYFGGVHDSSVGRTGYLPIVEFTADGRTVRFTDWLGSSSSGLLPTNVIVIYERQTPTTAMIDRQIMNWMPWAPIGAVGILLTLVALNGTRQRR